VEPHILIVDDNPANLKVLEEMLRQRGYEVSAFPKGELALAAAILDPPDLILLDIDMPEMSGYELCARLKADEGLASVPVMFLSALYETEDKVKAFQAGAVDFVSKPFQFDEVHARVETHLKLHALRLGLKTQNQRLEAAVAERTRELAESNAELRMLDRSKNDFLNLISHEFRTPLNGLLGIGEIALEDMAPTAENEQLKEDYRHSRHRILSILDDALLLTEIDVSGERVGKRPILLWDVLTGAMDRTAGFAESRGVSIHAPTGDMGLVVGDAALLERAFQALLETSVKFSEQGETVRLRSEIAADGTRVIIEGRGRTIPPASIARFFQIFSVRETINPGDDLGLGPPVAQRILASHGASVRVANLKDPSGIRLTVTLRNDRTAC
jgi:DNA-binding response OmpR family regulator